MKELTEIENPSFLKDLSIDELNELSANIREFLINSLSKTGGHLAPNLGVVELTIALHKAFNSPNDKLIWDVGHQTYTHKILTGRTQFFNSLRKYKGLSGFPKLSESEHDVWETGHSSTSISAAAGFVYSRDYKNEDHHVIPIIGDGALTGGMAFEALNHLGHSGKRVIVILNDNEMSISKNVGAFTRMLNHMRTSKKFKRAKRISSSVLSVESHLFDLTKRVKESIKTFMMARNIFEDMGFTYYGPINGHEISELISTFDYCKQLNEPVIIHVVTKKGHGYEPAATDQVGVWHGVGPYELETGKFLKKIDENKRSWSKVISEALLRLAKIDERIVAITPAMKNGSALNQFAEELPDRFIDVGIAEQHAITFAGGLAISGMKPFVSIYSTFLQRAYDQVSHDLARQNLPVVVGIDRSGIVGGDGETHQGIFDIAMLRHIPNVNIIMPRNAREAFNMLYSAFNRNELTFIRYPRGNTFFDIEDDFKFQMIKKGTWTTVKEGNELIFITYGPSVDYIADIIKKHHLNATLINARSIKPLDKQLLKKLLRSNLPIIIFEEAIKIGGLNSAILEFASDYKLRSDHIYSLGIGDAFVPQGDKKFVYKDLNLDEDAILMLVELALLNKKNEESKEKKDTVLWQKRNG
ncbi:1-deoxy-D-xylulose-5-phosphate synthase [Haloplasma contractile]|uniref:1-deoxy-D-xylulose-5-phosphate synthase n=1 Tax=Haloplasma contractile SSD-17B TaxID=1033810 RepID=U2EFR9_9MOLU|nr:1-deoxy-D-xylulose-5-phosphate synthase [Haloplasma contractile]ERJ13773.1 1-deoxy-D-xylulose-5-phosphate synthase protein [Haloplasma contractile SSD-17B]